MLSKRLSGFTFILAFIIVALLLIAPALVAGESNEPDAFVYLPLITRPMPEIPPDVTLPPVDPANLSGSITAAGSSIMFPLSESVVTRFVNDGFTDTIAIPAIGSAAGFAQFCETQEADIAQSSRPISAAERSSCLSNGRDPVEFRVGSDAIVIAVHPDNDFFSDATIAELQQALATADSWQELGGPNQPITRFYPGTDSLLFDFVVETVFDSDPDPIFAASNLLLSEDSNIRLQGVLNDPYAIGVFGLSSFIEDSNVKMVSVEGYQPAVATIESGEYPLARPLLLYSAPSVMQNKAQVAGFLNYYLTNVSEVVDSVGYTAPSTEALNTARYYWLIAMGLEP